MPLHDAGCRDDRRQYCSTKHVPFLMTSAYIFIARMLQPVLMPFRAIIRNTFSRNVCLMSGIKCRKKFIPQHIETGNHKTMAEQKRFRGKGIISIQTCAKLLWQQVCNKNPSVFLGGKDGREYDIKVQRHRLHNCVVYCPCTLYCRQHNEMDSDSFNIKILHGNQFILSELA
jgi:hypothetical protein